MRVLSAFQPSGSLHIGNYFGSIKPNLDVAAKADASFYYLVDLHALTSLQDGALLKKYTWDAVLDCLACGLDPNKSVMFCQSQVPEHAEMMWLLSGVTPMGLLERAVSYKDKVEKGITASSRPVRLSGADGGRHPALRHRTWCRWARTRSSTWR